MDDLLTTNCSLLYSNTIRTEGCILAMSSTTSTMSLGRRRIFFFPLK